MNDQAQIGAGDKAQQEESNRNAALGMYMQQLLATMLRGAVSVSQMDPRTVMVCMSRVCGQVMAAHFAGNGTKEGDEAVRLLREACSTQFSVGINQAPIPRFSTDQGESVK